MYLTEAQVRELGRRAKASKRSVANVVREAVDRYLTGPATGEEFEDLVDETFGALPDLEVPSRQESDRERPRRAPR